MATNKSNEFEEMVKNIPFLEYAAEQGEPAAMFWLGWNYLYGRNGVEEDSAKAYELIRKSAMLGYSEAQYILGMWYLTGNDGAEKPDYNETVRWFEAAATQGHVESAYELSCCFLKGKGVAVDVDASIKWLTQAADGGLAEAQCKLGEAYGNGEGVDKNMELSFKYLSLSANQGNAEAEYCLGILYRDGDGVPKDSKLAQKHFELSGSHGCSDGYVELYRMIAQDDLNEATKYLEKAAEAGNAAAQLQLGRHYEIGYGVEKSVRLAKRWYKMAAENGNEKAIESLERLE